MRRKIKKRLVFGIVLLMAAIVFAVAMTMNISANGPGNSTVQGNTLITERGRGRVIEVDSDYNIVWDNTNPVLVEHTFDLVDPVDAERLANGNTLITEYSTAKDFRKGRVIEVESDGTIFWDSTGLPNPFDLVYPVDAERIAGGHTLITEAGNHRVIEVDSSKNIVWDSSTCSTYPVPPIVLDFPQDAERLANGNTLITDTGKGRVIEVATDGTIVWDSSTCSTYPVPPIYLISPYDAERLANNGNTLITDTFNSRVIEVDSSGDIKWQKTGLFFPYDAERLANRNTLIALVTYMGGDRVIEVDSTGVIVWDSTNLENPIYLFSPMDAERLVPLSFFKTFIIEKAKIDFKKKPDDDKIHVKGRFELDLDSGDGVDISEDVLITIGPFSETIKMEEKGKGDKWEYKRPKGENGIKHMKIDWKKKKKKKKNHHAEFDIRVDKLEDMIWTNPVTINIQIGDDIGSETITMKVHKHHWDYHKKKH